MTCLGWTAGRAHTKPLCLCFSQHLPAGFLDASSLELAPQDPAKSQQTSSHAVNSGINVFLSRIQVHTMELTVAPSHDIFPPSVHACLSSRLIFYLFIYLVLVI